MTDWTPDSCSRLAEVAGDTLRPGGIELTEYLLGLGSFPRNSRILDAGCGMGATLDYLISGRRLDAIGVDSSQSMITAARRRSPELPVVCAELESLPFGEAEFDGILCECVLSQTSVRAVLAEFKRVLSVGGLLLVSDLYRKSGDRATGSQLITKEQTEIMLEEAGFMIEHWEDRSQDLRNLAIRLIMAPGSSGENLFGWSGAGCFWDKSECMDMGYYLLAARRSIL